MCGKPLAGRQRACSARCRAELSRRRQADVRAQVVRDLRAYVVAIRDQLADLEAVVGRMEQTP